MRMICDVWAIGLLLGAAALSSGQEQDRSDYAAKSLDQWIEALKNGEDPALRIQARQALGPDGPYRTVAVPALIEALGHKVPPVPDEAAATLADHGPAVVPGLVRALKSPKAPVRAAVAEALGLVRPRSSKRFLRCWRRSRIPAPTCDRP